MDMNDFQKGDEICVEWHDGWVDHGVFMRVERGFIVYTDDTGKQCACAHGHAKITKTQAELKDDE